MSITGGGKLSEVLEHIGSQYAGDKTLRVGFLEGATYPDGQSVAQVAMRNEYGVPENNQPPRPFFRDAIEAGKTEWPEKMAQMLKQGFDPDAALELMGEFIKGDVQDAIRYLDDPILSPVTIRKKGFANPLVDSGHMLNSVDYEVKGGGE